MVAVQVSGEKLVDKDKFSFPFFPFFPLPFFLSLPSHRVRTEGFESWGTSVLKIELPKYQSSSGPKCQLQVQVLGSQCLTEVLNSS